MTNSTPIEPGPGINGTPALIVLGRDETGKPHASWFGEQDVPLAAKAAELMGMSALKVEHEALRLLAGNLPQGRVFASGKAFVPFVKGELFDRLATHLPVQRAGGQEGRAEQRAASKDDVHDAADVPGDKAAQPSAVSSPTPAPADDWSRIRIGKVVLASEGKGEPWYEATVLQVKDEHLVLKWLDYPDEPDLVRKREQVALLHPKLAWPGAR